MVKIEAGIKLGFNDVLIRPKRSKLKSRSAVNLNRTYRFLHSTQTWTGIPIIAANMDTTGTFENAIEFAKNRMMVALHKHYTIEEWLNFISIQKKNNNSDLFNYIAVSSGTSDNDYNKIIEILNKCPEIRFICLDIANGYSEHFVEYVKKVRNTFKNHIIFAGNVVTPEMTEQLLLSGADAVKVGIGPGSVCTTRKKTGVGYPQISAVLECADAAHGLGGLIISDGGCTMPGDFSKAFGAGADFVMAGGIFSGYDESGGELIIKNGKKYKQFYGMSSSVAMKKYHNGVSNYRASEGKCVLVPYKGKIANCLLTILGGIRSTCTYVGAAKLKELSKRCTFIQCIEHHNRVFGDEKQNDGYHQSEHQSPSKQKSKIGNIGSIDINDKQILLKFLYEGFGKNNNNKTEDKKEENDKENKDNSNNDKLEVYDNNINKQLGDCLDVNGNKNNNNRKMEDVNIINLMSKDLKYEFFEWVYKKEQERIAKQCVNQAK